MSDSVAAAIRMAEESCWDEITSDGGYRLSDNGRRRARIAKVRGGYRYYFEHMLAPGKVDLVEYEHPDILADMGVAVTFGDVDLEDYANAINPYHQ